MKLAAYLIVSVLLISTAIGLGVAPSSKTVFFEPGKEIVIPLRVINNENLNTTVTLYASEDLSEYVEFSDQKLKFQGEHEKKVEYKLTLPKKLKPGPNILKIFVVDTSDNNIDMVNSNVGIIHKLTVHVPYPGQYIQALLLYSNAKPGETMTFTIPISNMGDEEISKISANILITDSLGNGIGQIKTNEISFGPGERKKIDAKWSADVDPGTYDIQAIIDYDDKILVLNDKIDIGEPLVQVYDLFVEHFKLGEIAKFNVYLKNLWNQDISDVKTTTEVYDENSEKLHEFEAGSISLPALATKQIASYWDTASITPGSYIYKVTTNYLGRSSKKTYNLSVSEDRIEIGGRTITGEAVNEPQRGSRLYLLIPIIIVLAILVFRFRPKKERKLDDVKSFVKYNLEQGMSPKNIKKVLLNKGYDSDSIDELILEQENLDFLKKK